MKTRNIVILLNTLLLISCKEPPITFEEAQPENIKNINKIPSKLRGTYLAASDSTKLIISSHLMMTEYVRKDTVPNQIYLDTVFAFSNGDILRKYKGYFFLNQPYKNNWEVKKLKINDDIIAIGYIASQDDIAKMEKITETKRDTSYTYIVKPTKKQLKHFIKENGFSEEELYIKIK